MPDVATEPLREVAKQIPPWLRVFNPDVAEPIPVSGPGPRPKPYVEIFIDELSDCRYSPEEKLVRLAIRAIEATSGADVPFTAGDVAMWCGMTEDRVGRILERLARRARSGIKKGDPPADGQGQLF